MHLSKCGVCVLDCLVHISEYIDDSFIIPRSSSVIAKRMPASKPGKGRAAIYVAGSNAQPTDRRNEQLQSTLTATAWPRTALGSISKRFDGKDDKNAAPKPHVSPNVLMFGRL